MRPLHVLSCICALVCVQAKTAVAKRRPRFVVYTRTFNDLPYVQYFVDWYLALEFDRIVMLDMSEHAGARLTAPPGRLTVVRARNTKNGAIYGHRMRALGLKGAEWVFVVDTDEFLVMEAPTIAQYVDELEARSGPVDVIQFRWAIYENLHPFCSDAPFAEMIARPPGLLVNAHVKSMTRIYKGLRIANPHYPFLDKTRTFRRAIGATVAVLNATQINHLAPPSKTPYVDSALVHVHTRSFADMLAKSLFGLQTSIRKGASPSAIRALVFLAKRLAPSQLMAPFYEACGTKAQLPAAHMRHNLLELRAQNVSATQTPSARVEQMLQRQATPAVGSARALQMSSGICDTRLELEVFAQTLKTLRVPMPLYDEFAQRLEQAYADTNKIMEQQAQLGQLPDGR